MTAELSFVLVSPVNKCAKTLYGLATVKQMKTQSDFLLTNKYLATDTPLFTQYVCLVKMNH